MTYKRITDRSELPGGLKPGARPGVDGWYWCQCEGYAAPEVVYVIAPGRIASDGKVFSPRGETVFQGSGYDSDKTRWYGPIKPPPAFERIGEAA